MVANIDDELLLVDGRNRRAACKIAGIDPTVRQMDGEDPTAYVLSANIHRRHMTKGQRAMAVAKIYPEPETGGRSKKATGSGKFPEVAQQRVSEARTVLQYSTDDDLVRDVLSGAKPLDTAYQVALERKKDAELSDESRLEELRSFYAV